MSVKREKRGRPLVKSMKLVPTMTDTFLSSVDSVAKSIGVDRKTLVQMIVASAKEREWTYCQDRWDALQEAMKEEGNRKPVSLTLTEEGAKVIKDACRGVRQKVAGRTQGVPYSRVLHLLLDDAFTEQWDLRFQI